MKRYVRYQARATKNIENLTSEFDAAALDGDILTSEYLTTTRANPENYPKNIQRRLDNWPQFGFEVVKILFTYDV